MVTFLGETPMMFLHALTDPLRKRFAAKTPPSTPTNWLQLEELEDRVVPSAFYTETYTNVTVEITPGLMMTEKVTASVTPFPSVDFSFSPSGGTVIVTPIPTGATIPTSGTVLFNLNNQMQSATLNANGQATATFQVPLLAFMAGQTLTASFQGTSNSAGGAWGDSTFIAPLYVNFDNLILPSTLIFGQLTPQQVYAEMISMVLNPPSPSESPPGSPPVVGPGPNGPPTVLNPYYTAQGETDSFGLFSFNYADPGTIDTVTVLGIQLPGIFALNLGAFNGLTSLSSSSS